MQFGTDKSSRGHGYLVRYHQHLAYLRECEGVVVAEIGVWTGASVAMWGHWLPRAEVIGVDIDLSRVSVPRPINVRLIEADAATLELPARSVDVLIDDGSHQAKHVTATLSRMWPAIRPGGWLIIEDWACQWEAGYGGNTHGSPATKALHRWVDQALLPQCDDVAELHCYEELAMIRKAP